MKLHYIVTLPFWCAVGLCEGCWDAVKGWLPDALTRRKGV